MSAAVRHCARVEQMITVGPGTHSKQFNGMFDIQSLCIPFSRLRFRGVVTMQAFTSLSRSRSLCLVCGVPPHSNNTALLERDRVRLRTSDLFQRVRLLGPKTWNTMEERHNWEGMVPELGRVLVGTSKGYTQDTVVLVSPTCTHHSSTHFGRDCASERSAWKGTAHVFEMMSAAFPTVRTAGFKHSCPNHRLPALTASNSISLHLSCCLRSFRAHASVALSQISPTHFFVSSCPTPALLLGSEHFVPHQCSMPALLSSLMHFELEAPLLHRSLARWCC